MLTTRRMVRTWANWLGSSIHIIIRYIIMHLQTQVLRIFKQIKMYFWCRYPEMCTPWTSTHSWCPASAMTAMARTPTFGRAPPIGRVRKASLCRTSTERELTIVINVYKFKYTQIVYANTAPTSWNATSTKTLRFASPTTRSWPKSSGWPSTIWTVKITLATFTYPKSLSRRCRRRAAASRRRSMVCAARRSRSWTRRRSRFPISTMTDWARACTFGRALGRSRAARARRYRMSWDSELLWRYDNISDVDVQFTNGI